MLTDSQGRGIAQAQIRVPAFTCTLPRATRRMLEKHPLGTPAEGDVLVTNDPWICHGHLPDFYVVMPIFREGRAIAFYGAAAHVADVAGRLDELPARDVCEEGFRLPSSSCTGAAYPIPSPMR